jgi:ribonuclease P protein component
MIALAHRLRKHADYQLVYNASRKQFARQTSYFFMLRPLPTSTPQRPTGGDVRPSPAVPQDARVGLTVGKAMGKAVDRNRIKRRMRAAVRSQLHLLDAPVDVVLHPKRSVIDLDFAALQGEVADVFRKIQKVSGRQRAPAPATA